MTRITSAAAQHERTVKCNFIHLLASFPCAARNVLANSDYCKQCLSAGGPSTGQVWPAGKHGLCGDPFSSPTPRKHEAGGKYWTGEVRMNDFLQIDVHKD